MGGRENSLLQTRGPDTGWDLHVEGAMIGGGWLHAHSSHDPAHPTGSRDQGDASCEGRTLLEALGYHPSRILEGCTVWLDGNCLPHGFCHDLECVVGLPRGVGGLRGASGPVDVQTNQTDMRSHERRSAYSVHLSLL